jgi:inosine-uridine nucleoside N-ribohydrolase
MTSNSIVIDCDTGRDDALSLWLALASGMDLAAVVASYGNTTLENVSENCARVLALAGRSDIQLWQGETFPSRAHAAVEAILLPKQKVSGNGLCNLELPRASRQAEVLDASARADRLRQITATKGAIDYVILGPATNFAATCEALGDEAGKVIASVTMMGGKMDGLWDEMPGADFNIACDPFSVQTLLEQGCDRGFPVRFVPMNVTWPIVLDMLQLESLTASSVIGQTAKDLMIAHARHFAPEPVFRFHDPCVILALMETDTFRVRNLRVVCDEASVDFGRLVDDDTGCKVHVLEATSELRDQFLNEILTRLSISRA